MGRMANQRDGYHRVHTELPEAMWQWLQRRADDDPRAGGSVGRLLAFIVADLSGLKVPPRKRPGPKAGRRGK